MTTIEMDRGQMVAGLAAGVAAAGLAPNAAAAKPAGDPILIGLTISQTAAAGVADHHDHLNGSTLALEEIDAAVYGGAAGLELDRYDLKLGTPPHTRIIASSGGHTDNYGISVEEILYNYPGMTGTQDYRIRADMVYFNAPNDGGVFATGSIAFAQALPCKNFDNSVSRVLKNVVDAFSRAGPLPGQAWISDEKQWR